MTLRPDFIKNIIRECYTTFPIGSLTIRSILLAHKLKLPIEDVEFYLSEVNYENNWQ